MRKRFITAFGALSLIVVACGGGTSPAPSGAAGSPGASTEPGASASAGSGELADVQELKIWLGPTDPASMHPQMAYGADEIAVLSGIQRGLLYYDQNLGLVPALAEKMPDISADGLTYTFTLRDAKYSNGETIVAGDIVRGMQQLADPRNGFAYGYEMCPVAGADQLMGSDFCVTDVASPDAKDNALIDSLIAKLGVTAPDDKTLVVKLSRPVNFFSNIMGMWLTTPVPASQTSWAEASDLVASGPFMMESWIHNSEIVLVPNPNWYGDVKPTLTKITLSIGGDPEAAVATYEQGGFDMVVVPSTSTVRVKEDPVLSPEIKDTPQLSVVYYDFATCQSGPEKCPKSATTADGRSPLANKNFRIALSQAVNRQELIDVAYSGMLQPAAGTVMTGIPGWPDDYDPYKFDVAAAQEHMATAIQELGIKDTTNNEGGPPDGKIDIHDVGKLKFGFNCDAGHTPRVTYLAGAWRTNLGFGEGQLDISCTDFAVFKEERRAGNVYDITRNGWGADFPHPDNQLRDLFACGAGNSNSHYCNKAFDDLLNTASQEGDPTKAHDLYVQAQRMMIDDAPSVFFGFLTIRNLVKPYVSGITSTASDHENIGDVFYETIKLLKQ